jgi:hypothetical protein
MTAVLLLPPKYPPTEAALQGLALFLYFTYHYLQNTAIFGEM